MARSDDDDEPPKLIDASESQSQNPSQASGAPVPSQTSHLSGSNVASPEATQEASDVASHDPSQTGPQLGTEDESQVGSHGASQIESGTHPGSQPGFYEESYGVSEVSEPENQVVTEEDTESQIFSPVTQIPNASAEAPEQSTESQDLSQQSSFNPSSQQKSIHPSVTADEVFGSLKVSKLKNPEDGQSIQSFIIAKTKSSENVVVLLNLRRHPDGEWVLDKTIAQSLNPKTEGSVVDIDKYDQSLAQSQSKFRPKTKGAFSGVPEDMKEVLRKMEDCVAQMNQEIQAARDLMKNIPNCDHSPNQANSDVTSKIATSESPFNELFFVDKLVKMFNILISEDEPCDNLCNQEVFKEGSEDAISFWLRNVMAGICSYYPGGCSDNNANDEEGRPQPEVSLAQVQQSGLLAKLSSNGLLSNENTNDSESGTQLGTTQQSSQPGYAGSKTEMVEPSSLQESEIGAMVDLEIYGEPSQSTQSRGQIQNASGQGVVGEGEDSDGMGKASREVDTESKAGSVEQKKSGTSGKSTNARVSFPQLPSTEGEGSWVDVHASQMVTEANLEASYDSNVEMKAEEDEFTVVKGEVNEDEEG